MSAYLVGAVDIFDPSGYETYRESQGAVLAEFGGELEILSKDGHPEVIEGEQPAGHRYIIKFASMERVHAFFASDAYGSIAHYRHESARTRFIMAMRGLDEDA